MSREDPRIQQTPDEMQSCATLTAKTGVRGRHPWFSPHRSRTHLLKSYYEQADSCLLGLCNGKSGSQGAPSPVGERTLKKKIAAERELNEKAVVAVVTRSSARGC